MAELLNEIEIMVDKQQPESADCVFRMNADIDPLWSRMLQAIAPGAAASAQRLELPDGRIQTNIRLPEKIAIIIKQQCVLHISNIYIN